MLNLFFINNSANAKDAEKIEVEFEQTKKVVISGITRFAIVDPKIAKVELENNVLYITGIKYGSTPLFVWKKNELVPYVIYSVAPKNLYQYIDNRIVYSIDMSKPYGYYNVFTSLAQNDINSSQNINHQFYYRQPIFNGFFTFNGIVNNSFLNLKDIQRFDLGNLNLNFSNKNLSASIGDIFNLSYSTLSSLRAIQFKGASIKYSDLNFTVGAFGGLENQPLVIYSKNDINRGDSLAGGVYGSIFPLKNLFLSGGYNLKSKSGNLLEPNIVGGIRWTPLNSLYLSGEMGSDFNGKIAYNFNSYFYHGWEKTKESLRLSTLINHFDRGYGYTYNTDRTNILFNMFFNHKSGINFSGSAGRFSQSNISNNSLNLRATKIFDNTYNTFAELGYNNSISDNVFRVSTGLELLKYIPLNISYTYAKGMSPNIFDDNYLSMALNFLENKDFRGILAGSVRYSDNNSNKEKSLFSNANIGLNYSGLKKINLYGALGYGNYLSSLRPTSTNNYSLTLSTSWELSVYNKLNFSTVINKDSINPFNVASNIGYTYSFGKAVDDAYTVGSIKGNVFDDSNFNDILDEDEKIISGVKIKIDNKEYISTDKGYYALGIDYGNYEINVDKNTLPKGYKLGSNIIETITLANKEKEYNIPIRFEGILKGYIYADKNSNKGIADIKIIIDNKDFVTTDSEGYFNVSTKPGKHTLKLDFNTIPQGYSFNENLTREVETSDENEIIYIFNPVRNITIQAYKADSIKTNFVEGMTPVKDIEVETINKDGKITKYKTDEDGLIEIEEIETGMLTIRSNYLSKPLEIDITDEPFNKLIEIPIVDGKK